MSIRSLRTGLGNFRDARMMMCSEQRSGSVVELNIREARKALQTEGPREALGYLDAMIEAHLESKDQASARRLLAEADSLIRTRYEPGLIYYDLRMGVYHYNLGETGEARAIFNRVIQEAEKRKDDAIWTAAAITFSKINEFKEAIWCADRIEDKATKFSIFLNLADLLMEQGRVAESRAIILNHCVLVARSHSDNNHWVKQSKIAQLLIAAERLVKIGANQDANSILFELIEMLPKYWPSMSHSELEKREEISVLLVKSGQRAKAIDLMTGGWLTEEFLATLKSDEVLAAKMKIIDSHWKKLSQALKGG